MDIEKIDQSLEALLFVSGDPLTIAELASALEIQKSEINQSLGRLKQKYSGDSGIHLIVFNGRIQLRSNPACAPVVESVLNPIREKELTRATLETVAIIAYKQPITRLELDQIRGVDSGYAVSMLLTHNLIEVVGRKDAIGKPLLYGTTDQFLKKFQLESVNDLPNYQQLLEQIRVIEGVADAALYNEFEIPEEMPAHLEGEEDVRLVSAQTDAECEPATN